MYLSSLLIDLGDNPDRPRPGRLWLRNLYHVHQRLCMAFPSKARKSDDEEFIKPFKPDDFGDVEGRKQVHVPRKEDAGFLFRIDPLPSGRAAILVQSAAEPDWSYGFRNAEYLLAAFPQVKEFDPNFQAGQTFRFRLASNPTKRVSSKSKDENGKPLSKEWVGKRVPVPTIQLEEWLEKRAEPAGFVIDKATLNVWSGYVCVKKKNDHNGQSLRSARYEGILEVTDADTFRKTLCKGIGPAKAFGFGLLSVAKA